MQAAQPDTTPRHPIGVVVRRTGIPQDLLRAWERRYDAVVPGRSETGRRLYSDHDVLRLRLLKRAVDGGRRISDVAGLSIEDLQALTVEDQSEVQPQAASRVQRAKAGPLLAECLDAVAALDRRRLELALNEAAVSMSSPTLRHDLLVPLLESIGDRWRDGVLRVSHEHLASAIVRRFLDSMRNGGGPPTGPKMIVTTPSNQQHELGALLAAATAEESGWQVAYLGPNTPAEEIAAAARQVDARAVALSVIYAADERGIREEILKVRKFLDPAVHLLLGGRALGQIDLEDQPDIISVPDLVAFQHELERLLPS